MQKNKKIGILGGGLAGCTLAGLLADKHEVEIIEASDHLGGLCSTLVAGEKKYDIGGHIIFGKTDTRPAVEYMLECLDDNRGRYKRNNGVKIGDAIIKYPFEYGYGSLPKEIVSQCLLDYINTDNTYIPLNFHDWLYAQYGNAIVELYLKPYNEKMWQRDLHEIGLEWCDRLPRPNLTDMVNTAIGYNLDGYTHQLYFHYPLRGGIQALPYAMLRDKGNITIHLNRAIRQVYRRQGKWVVCVSDGVSQHPMEYDEVISTIPIQELVRAYMPPDEIVSACRELVSLDVSVSPTNTHTVPEDMYALFIPDDTTIYHRICNYRIFGQDIQIGETTSVEGIKYAYPVYTKDHKQITRLLYKYFQDEGIILCGRSAEHEYMNMDDVVERAMVVHELF